MTVPIFPTLGGLTYPLKRTPLFRTLHQEAVSGQDNPIELWAYPRWQYELIFTFLRHDAINVEWDTLAAFFLAMRGSSRVFQFADPDDNAVTDQSIGVGDGVTTTFPLVRTLSGGSFTFTEPVFAPVVITNVKDNGTPTAAYTLGTQGLITFNAPPTAGHTLTWTGTYNWLARFDTDVIDFEKFAKGFFELKKVTLTTIKTQSK